ncbi:MAG: peptidoglycan DD-metalloendopeptidase family protein [Gammaproteobacteria bacterium]|nr:peptidoglycan DD-metalloendopeptidase family protein [Gammaproteobacteria bacterium]
MNPAGSSEGVKARHFTVGIMLCICIAAPAWAVDEAARLDEIRGRIEDMQTALRKAHDESDALLAELQHAEAAIGQTRARVSRIGAEAERKSDRLGELRMQEESQRSVLAQQRAELADQIRTAYASGRHDYLKLLLNQEDPALLGRMLAYHDYASRARARDIEVVVSALNSLADTQSDIANEAIRLEELQTLETARLAELETQRESRGLVLARLRETISSRDRELALLQRNEQELARLLDKLRGAGPAARPLEDVPPFISLKGKLKWPAAGPLTHRFGDPRMGGRLRFQGVTIGAPTGSDVRAVGTGKVIFADWFRNMGLLVIIDHGEEFMSLYGHNESLLKKPGDFVQAGEIVAKVGDTGGQEQAGLYFEIRQSGNPLDPYQWCRG